LHGCEGGVRGGEEAGLERLAAGDSRGGVFGTAALQQAGGFEVERGELGDGVRVGGLRGGVGLGLWGVGRRGGAAREEEQEHGGQGEPL